jgi:SIS domain
MGYPGDGEVQVALNNLLGPLAAVFRSLRMRPIHLRLYPPRQNRRWAFKKMGLSEFAGRHPAGEMKHGPNALIDESLPVVIIATRDPQNWCSVIRYEKTLSNLKEVKARSGVVIALATEGDEEIKEATDHVLYIPPTWEELSPILEIVPLQLLAYDTAVRRGCDVDQPRNLAKSVTVE